MSWDDVRDVYIRGDASLPDTARECGVSQHTIKDVAAREKWSAQREEYRKKHGKKRRDDEDHTRARTVDFGVLQNAEKELEQTLVQAVRELSGMIYSGDLYRGWGREMADIAQALQACIRAKRDMGDAPDQAERARQEIARAKVAVDKERNRMQAKRDELAAGAAGKGSGEIHVTVTGIADGGEGYGG